MSAVHAISNDYFCLVKRFPLVPIRNAKKLVQATAIIDELSDSLGMLTRGERDYFDVLTDLVVHYENTAYPTQNVEPGEALKFLIEVNNLTLTSLANSIGSPKSHLSAFLNGYRGLSKTNAVKLANYFKVSPALFLPKVLAS